MCACVCVCVGVCACVCVCVCVVILNNNSFFFFSFYFIPIFSQSYYFHQRDALAEQLEHSTAVLKVIDLSLAQPRH